MTELEVCHAMIELEVCHSMTEAYHAMIEPEVCHSMTEAYHAMIEPEAYGWTETEVVAITQRRHSRLQHEVKKKKKKTHRLCSTLEWIKIHELNTYSSADLIGPVSSPNTWTAIPILLPR